jgi:pyruvate dehydrogenase E1 component alpha subunit
VERARKGEGPTLVEVKLSRFYGHFEGDAQTYRGPDEVKNLRESHDCLAQFRQRCTAEGWLDSAQFDAIDAKSRN